MAFIAPLAAAGAGVGTAAAATAGSTLLSTLGTVASVGGTLYSGYTAMQEANYQAKLSEYNASLSEDNARRAVERAQIEQQSSDNEAAAIIGEQLAAQGASGISIGSRSAMLTRKSQAELNRKDALNIRQAGDVEAYNYKQDAAGLRASADAQRKAGRTAMISSLFSAGTSLLSNAKPTAKAGRYSRVPTPRPTSLYGARR